MKDLTRVKLMTRICLITVVVVAIILGIDLAAYAQAESSKEEDYFKIMKIPVPDGMLLEVGGLCTLPNGNLVVTTRRGDIYTIENPSSPHPFFRRFAFGLHEVLGAAYKDGALYVAQRGELTKLVDTNMDGKADLYETVYAWPLTGNYHEYSYGPKLAPDGSFFVTLNCTCLDTWWHMESKAPWRGWTLNITENGTVTPWAAGMRSPCGISMVDGELWYSENQGDWVGSGGITLVKKGGFMGHPASLAWTGMPNSPLKLSLEQFYAKNNPRVEFDKSGQPFKPQNIVNEKFKTKFEANQEFPEIALPAVWLPHGILGISNAEIVKIPENVFGPFSGQLLVSDQGQSMIDRIFLENVNGEFQGAAWAFRSGFQSGITRLAWLADGSLAAGETSRGWGAAGDASMGLQRLVWNNKTPFEMRAVRAMPDGFEVEFTEPVDKEIAEDIASYSVESFIYKYQGVYGSPPVNTEKCPITGIKLSEDGLKARLIVSNLRRYYIHTINLDGIRDRQNHFNLVHPVAYYTLNNIPEGKKLALAETSTKNSGKAAKTASPALKNTPGTKDKIAKTLPVSNKAVTSEMVKPMLLKYTCNSCHNADKRQVGPAFKDVAKRKYTIAEIIQLIHNPKPEHWPDYSTPMPPMPQVPDEDAKKIAQWINSLSK